VSAEISRSVSIARTGGNDGEVGLRVVLSPVDGDPAGWIDVTLGLTLIVDPAMPPTFVDIDLVRDADSAVDVAVPIGPESEARGEIGVHVLVMHGTRFYGMHELTIPGERP
jgi:hypothetical protein